MADDPEDTAFDRRIADARPEADPLTRAVWRARVGRALFGDAPAVHVGRYRLGRTLGRGGGGAVFAASDPELDREVAIKLIRCASPAHRARALAEGRALAKLSHPNVVAVHDVGETADHVYLVMELLRGPTLRELDRDVIAAYRQAASGLAAAHARGLIHRDFKPDNAMLGDDGRLRVVDFGLATDGATDGADASDHPPAGTPRYMAPEQRAGQPPSAAADQYALGVSLREAITGRAPAWLARVLSRATAEDPAARYPSLDALARALGHDPRLRRRRRAALAAALIAALAAFALGRGQEPAACAGPDLAPAWTAARRTAVLHHLAQLATPFAASAAPMILDRLDGLGRAWLATARRSCTAHARGALSDALYDRAQLCLARARTGLGEAVELIDQAAGDQLAPAVSALAQVERAERCDDPAVLAGEPAPASPALRVIDHQIELAAIHARAQTARAVALARTAASLAELSGDPARRARAELVLGHAYMAGQRDRALAPLHDALGFAIASGQDDTATEAYARQIYVRAMVRGERTPDGLELARAIAARGAGGFARALLANNVGSLAMLAGDVPRARAELRRAVAEAAVLSGPGGAELQAAVSNLALITPDPAERRRLYATAVAQAIAAVGPDHPQSLDQQLLALADRDDPAAVVDGLVPLCQRIAALHPSLERNLERCAGELAWQATALDQPARVRDVAALLASQTRPLARLVASYAALAAGPPSPSLLTELEDRARGEADAVARDGWIQHWSAANAGLVLAAAARAAGDAPRARRAAAAAIAHLEAYRAVTGVVDGKLTRRLQWARRVVAQG